MRLERRAAALSLLAVAACGGVTVKQHAIGNRIVPVDSTPAEAVAPAPAPAAPSPTILSRPILVGNDRGGRPQVRKGEHDAAPSLIAQVAPVTRAISSRRAKSWALM